MEMDHGGCTFSAVFYDHIPLCSGRDGIVLHSRLAGSCREPAL